MNILKRYRLKKQQKELMRRYAILEQLQTEHNEDEYFYKYTQCEMDSLDEQAEYIRGILEGRWDA
ncbi:hypothetical protein D7V94_21475 [Parablautia intestinalis]|uniref:Uncharacterized protein n=1 Tax=Parablautia intestinalis TaxID=2320100 RepID=A0A3A9AI18_9FIRM|nr:hypothetical protein [Parablautia intestinalis]RKI87123.1 hypothetical protein D7V94_21475 [Parablautia intestinalis]